MAGLPTNPSFVQINSGNVFSVSNIKFARQNGLAMEIAHNDGSVTQYVYADDSTAAAALASLAAQLPSPAFVTLTNGTMLAAANIKSLTLSEPLKTDLIIGFNDGSALAVSYADTATAQAALNALYASLNVLGLTGNITLASITTLTLTAGVITEAT